jgi:sporulation related protein
LAVEAFNDLLKKYGKRGQWEIRYWIRLGSMWRAIAVLLIATTAARAAAIDVVSLGPNDPTLVKLTGPSSDKDLFLRKVLPLSSAVVAFDSDGGSLLAGPPQMSGGYLVQVSSQRNEADAQAAYRALQDKFPAVLGSRAPLIMRADLGDRVFYRAAVGPFATPDEAFQFCSNLKSAGGQCVVQRN